MRKHIFVTVPRSSGKACRRVAAAFGLPLLLALSLSGQTVAVKATPKVAAATTGGAPSFTVLPWVGTNAATPLSANLEVTIVKVVPNPHPPSFEVPCGGCGPTLGSLLGNGFQAIGIAVGGALGGAAAFDSTIGLDMLFVVGFL